MKFIAKKDDLLTALSHVQSVVERRNSVPILSNVKIDADKGSNQLTLTTTDMDIAVHDKLSADIKEEGSLTVPAHTFFEIIRKVSENVDVELTKASAEDSNVDLLVGSSEFTLPSLPAEEFPNFEVSESTHNFVVHSQVLKTLLSKTKHAISTEETRYYLNGTYLHTTTDDGTPVLRAVATDGHRLARAQTIQPEGCQDMPGIIIPKKTVGELVKLLEEYTGDVNIALSQNKIVFTLNDAVISSKLIDGKFPDYDRVIPKDNDKVLEISRAQLARAIDLVISISNDKTRAVRLNIEPGKVVVNASSEINGNAKGAEEVTANFDSKESVSIGFNSRYVLDSLSAIEGDTVRMQLSNNVGAVAAQDSKESNCLYILMPMQV